MRGSPAVVILPNVLELRLLLGKPRLTLFRALKVSKRNWTLKLSRIGKSLCNPRLSVVDPGPRREFLPVVPYVPSALTTKALVSNHCNTFSPLLRPSGKRQSFN